MMYDDRLFDHALLFCSTEEKSCIAMDPEFRSDCHELLKRIVHLRDCL
jgi:hypothetical protein